MSDFSLPRLQQDQFSTYFDKKIPRTDNATETIIYPGKQLTISSKARNLKRHIAPEHVFITKVEYDDDRQPEFLHKLYGNDNQWTILPKRLYSVCFPKIHLGSIPRGNRIKIRLTDSIHVTLPFVPDEFYKQKQTKAHRTTSKVVTRRNKRQRIPLNESDEVEEYDGWMVYGMNPSDVKKITKPQLMNQLRGIMDEITARNVVVKNPFGEVDDLNGSEDTRSTLITIIQFIYHYAREELRMQAKDDNPIDETLWETIKDQLQ